MANKSKLNWRFAKDIHDAFVNPMFVKALKPLDSLVFVDNEKGYLLHLRTCAQAVDKKGKIHYLYCTEHTCRFFYLRIRDCMLIEQKTGYRPNRPSKKSGGHANYMDMPGFGLITCHVLIAHAWVHNRYDYMIEVMDEQTGKTTMVCTMQIDHRDGNTLNNDANNLEYVTADENTRRRTLFRRLRATGFDPASCTTAALRMILEANH